jgi:hypothetical protein
VEILQRRHADNAALDKPSDYVFPSWGAAGHITEPKAAWKRIIDRAGIKDLRLHDLRRTLGSWQAATGASLSIIGRSLGHKNVATTAVYARLDLDPVRASVNTAADAIMAAANGHAPKKALPALSDAEGAALSAAEAPAPADGKAKKPKGVKAKAAAGNAPTA